MQRKYRLTPETRRKNHLAYRLKTRKSLDIVAEKYALFQFRSARITQVVMVKGCAIIYQIRKRISEYIQYGTLLNTTSLPHPRLKISISETPFKAKSQPRYSNPQVIK